MNILDHIWSFVAFAALVIAALWIAGLRSRIDELESLLTEADEAHERVHAENKALRGKISKRGPGGRFVKG